MLVQHFIEELSKWSERSIQLRWTYKKDFICKLFFFYFLPYKIHWFISLMQGYIDFMKATLTHENNFEFFVLRYMYKVLTSKMPMAEYIVISNLRKFDELSAYLHI